MSPSSFESVAIAANDALIAYIIKCVRDELGPAVNELLTDSALKEKTDSLIKAHMDVSEDGWVIYPETDNECDITDPLVFIGFCTGEKPIESLDDIPFKYRKGISEHIDGALNEIFDSYLAGEGTCPDSETAEAYIVATYNVYIDNKTSLTKAAR